MKTLVLLIGLLAQTAIKIPPLPLPVAPVMHVDTLSLAATAAAGSTSASMTLAAPPISGMGALCVYQGANASAVTPLISIQQAINFTFATIPAATDQIQMVYWSVK